VNRYFFALGFATLMACGSSTSSNAGAGGSGGSLTNDGGAGNASVCIAGRQLACSCSDGAPGAHACKADGSGYTACTCATSDSSGGAGAGGEAGTSSARGGASGTDAGAGGEAGISSAGEGGMSASCSPDALATTTEQGVAALQALFASTATFCLPQVTGQASGADIAVCTSAACANTANTCTGALSSPAFSFDRATSNFTVTGDLQITGAATAAPLGNCPALQIDAPATTVSGTLQASLEPAVNPTSVVYTATQLVVQANSISVAGCGATLDGLLDLVLAVDAVKATLEQAVAKQLSQQSFTIPCASLGSGGA
jgi:hypothetical protein